ncbi:hypothetical protein [Mycolicibacterium fluoranthenivorans]|uniref:hypothetical protein n=1 Tax=Mycolicibacterium fluoranthenivorans TaxID=258505 RepID=UPI000B878658|nr:hypothetical protein [Mycolicibacterium fluoranthenivorans]
MLLIRSRPKRKTISDSSVDGGGAALNQSVEGSDAGPAQEFLALRKVELIQRTHADAQGLADAARITQLFSSAEAAEQLAREALTVAAKAYWFAEQTDLAEFEHKYLHEIGRWTRMSFGCQLDCHATQYSTSCPVLIADKRMGLSIGAVCKVTCSFCGEDMSECGHRRERLYWAIGGRTEFGPCRVCGKQKCDHKSTELYAVPVKGILHDCVLEEASVVDVPADPLARQTKLDIGHQRLQELLGDAFTPGIAVNCDHCMETYHGLPESLDVGKL